MLYKLSDVDSATELIQGAFTPLLQSAAASLSDELGNPFQARTQTWTLIPQLPGPQPHSLNLSPNQDQPLV